MELKLLNFVSSLYGGGAEKFVADISFYFCQPYEHTILTYNFKEKKYPYCGTLLDWNNKKSRYRIISMINIYYALKKLKKTDKNQVYISHMLIPNLINCLSKNNEYTIIVIHGKGNIISEKSKIIDKFINLIYNKADLIVCVSNYMKQLLLSNHKIKCPISVIYNGIDIEKIREYSKCDPQIAHLPKKYIIYVASLRKIKNHIGLLDNLKLFLKRSNYSLVLVGEGSMRKELENKILQDELDQNVILLGNVENPFPIVKNARYAIVASKSESFSLTTIEALSLGVPVISTDCGGPREILTPDLINENSIQYPARGLGGIVISNNLTESIGYIIEKVDGDNQLYKKLSLDGIKRAEDFHIRHSYFQYRNMIYNLLNK